MPYRKLGRIGERVSIVGLGGYHIGMPSLLEREAIRIIRTVIDNGIHFLDNCWDYNGGESEVRMGKALRDGYRQKAFLITKIDGRTRRMASQQLEESLCWFKTEHVDLIQFHELIRMSDPDRIFASGGSIEAVLVAKNGGKFAISGSPGMRVQTFT
jgi:predicted aldo/keto reductase-like oxidoreductase